MAESIVIPNFYDYINQQNKGYENLSETELDVFRKQYNTYRNRLYKQRQRTQKREITLYLNSSEHTQLSKISKDHNLILSHYLKQAAFAYANQKFIVPDKKTLKNILLELKEIENSIAKLATNRSSKMFFSTDKYEALATKISEIQNTVLYKITQPVNTEAWIKRELTQNPIFRKSLIGFLLNEIQ